MTYWLNFDSTGVPVPIDDVFAGRDQVSPPPGWEQRSKKASSSGTDPISIQELREELHDLDRLCKVEGQMTPQELGDHVGRRISTLVVGLAVVLYMYPPPSSSPLYAVPFIGTILRWFQALQFGR